MIDRFTYEIAPVFVLMEQLTLKKMREMIGWPDGEGDGLFSPGSKHLCAMCVIVFILSMFFR